MNKNSSSFIKNTDIFSYSIPALPLAFAGMPIYIMAPDFYASQYGLSLSIIGFILLGLRFFDAVQDPIIGRLSDKYSKFRLQIIIFFSIILILSFAAVFFPAEDFKYAWFALSVLIATTSFSVVSINLNTLGGLWTNNEAQKTRITSFRESLGLFGLLFAVSFPALIQVKYDIQTSYIYLSIIFAALMLSSLILFRKWYKKDLCEIKSSKNITITFYSSIIIFSKKNKTFLSIYSLGLVASSIPAVLVLFFIRDKLGAVHNSAIFLLIYFLFGAIGMPLWHKLSRCKGMFFAWGSATILAVVSFIWAFFLNSGEFYQFAVICAFSGIAFGADLSLPPAILSDYIQNSKESENATTFFSVLAFISKAALAVASVAALPVLELYGFKAAQPNSEESLLVLSVCYALIPCILKLLSALIIFINLKNLRGFYEVSYPTFSDRSNADV